MTDEDVPIDAAAVTGVDIGNIANHPYLGNNPYRELANDDDDDNTADDTEIEIVAAPAEIPRTIIDVGEESTGVVDREIIGVTDEHTGVKTSDNEESTRVPDT